MKTTIQRAVLAILLLGGVLLPASGQAVTSRWSSGTAHTTPKGRWEFGIFQPLTVGVTDRITFSTHPVVDILMPNLTLKVAWESICGWDFATEHTLTSPTPLLMVISREGTGGILPNDTVVPWIVTLSNTVYATRQYAKGHLFTAKIASHIAARFGPSTLPTIDLPVVFPRTSAWHDVAAFNFGVDLAGKLAGDFRYEVDVDLWLMPRAETFYAFEHSAVMAYRPLSWFGVEIGYKIILGQYPYGFDWHILPLIDLQFAVD